MIWIGLTGGMGCGKSSALSIFKKLGCGTESADRIVSELYTRRDVLDEICKTLDITTFGELDEIKSEISKKVFAQPENLKKLENLLHPLVRKKSEEAKRSFSESGVKVSFYEVPLLFEKNLESHFNQTLCIGAERNIQIQRIKKRNPNWSAEEIENRLNSQLSLENKKNLSNFYIDNSGSIQELEVKCRSYLDRLLA